MWASGLKRMNEEHLRTIINAKKRQPAEMEDDGQRIRAETLVEVDLDLEVR